MIRYLISDPAYEYKNFNTANYVCYRDKNGIDFEKKAKAFITKAKACGIENIFLNEKHLLAKKLGVTGVHLTSKQFNLIKEVKSIGLKVIISCHCELDIEKAIEKEVDFITYSPIFETPNKGEPKGIEDLKRIVSKYNIKIIALGGIITEEQIKQIKASGAVGFASIRYFTTQQSRSYK